ncbi:MAG: hypothetical protein U0414_16350 [Polyangiaceae bacterium]
MRSSASDRLPLFGAFGLGGLAASILLIALVRGSVARGGAPDTAGESGAEGSAATAPSGAAVDGKTAEVASISKEPVPSPMTNAELDAASTPAALETLAAKYPKEPRLWRKLAAAYDAKSTEPALKAVRRLFELDPASTNDVQMHRIIQRAAAGPATTADMAFETMTSMMGKSGPDLLWEIVVAPSTPSAVSARAWDLLQKDAGVRGNASAALKVAIDLKAHNGCDRKPYIAVAEKEGDKRSLNYLTQLLPVTKCGFLNLSTCADCFGDRSDIQRAIVAINNREKPAP